MTQKQKLKSIEKKMERIQSNMPCFDLITAVRNINQVNRFYQLEREHFFLKLNIAENAVKNYDTKTKKH